MAALLSLAAALAAVAVVLLWGLPARAVVHDPTEAPPVEDAAPPRGWRTRVEELHRRLRPRRAERERDVELQVLDGLAAALEAGLPVPQAVTLAVSQAQGGAAQGPDPVTGPGWTELVRAAGEGQSLAPVWQRLARRSGSPTLASVARAWRVAALTGAPLARAIRVSAHASRERRRLERAVQVATAGARATVTVLTLLPLAGVGLAAVLGVSPTDLYSHPVALASAGAGATLVLVGQLWSRRMVTAVLGGTT